MADFNFSNLFGIKKEPVKPMREMGVSGATVVSGWIQDREKNPKLSYLQRNVNFEEMLANISIVGAGVRYFTALAASAKWTVTEAEGDTSRQYADFVELAMSEVENPWSDIVSQAVMHKFYGFSVQEWTAKRDKVAGHVIFKSIDKRPQRTIERFDIDKDGGLIGFGQQTPISGEELYIPRAKTFYLVDDLLTDSPAGLGVLRHIFETCERLTNYHDLELQGFQKDLRNLPIARIPYAELNAAVDAGDMTEEKAQAAIRAMENVVKLVRKQPETGFAMDSKTYLSKSDTALNSTNTPQWDLTLLQGESPGLPEVAAAIERLQIEVSRVLGTEAMMLSGGGSQALSKDKSTNLYLNVNATLENIAHVARKDLLDPLWKLNGFPDDMKPTFKVEEVNSTDAESVAAVMRDMATAGAPIMPDDEVVNDVRAMLGVSAADLDNVMLEVESE